MTTYNPPVATVASADGTMISYRTLGSGDGVILVGGTLQSGHDYLPLAERLSRSLAVHVVDRRGRGGSGPQGAGYSVDAECDDLLAVQGQTGASMIFGHSYGGLVALEVARRVHTFRRVAVYEPGVSIAGSVPEGWLPEYRRLLAAGDSRGAFAVMALGAGHAPAPLARLPLRMVRTLMYGMPKRQWRQLRPLLPTALPENEEIARLDAPAAERFSEVTASVLLLGGTKSPPAVTTRTMRALHDAIPTSELQLLAGLRHTAPVTKAASLPVAESLLRFFQPSGDRDHAPSHPA